MQSAQVQIQSGVNQGFAVPALVTRAGSIVRRSRLYFPPNSPGVTYGNVSSQGAVLNKVVFDLQNATNFIDLTKLTLVGNFMGSFRAHAENQSNAGATSVNDVWYDNGASPVLDQGTQALIVYLRILTQQNTVIEEVPSYGLLSNIVEAHSESISHKEYSMIDFSCGNFANYLPYMRGKNAEVGTDAAYAYDNSSRLIDNLGMLVMPALTRSNDKAYINAGQVITFRQIKSFNLMLYNSSFLQRVKYFPLKHMNNALRIEITFQEPRKSFYNNWLGTPPRLLGYINESQHLRNTLRSTVKTLVSTAFTGGTTGNLAWGSMLFASDNPTVTAGSNDISGCWHRILQANIPPTYALTFGPGVVTSMVPSLFLATGSASIGSMENIGDALPPILGEARVGDYWMFAYNGRPITILKVVGVAAKMYDSATGTGNPALVEPVTVVLLQDQGTAGNAPWNEDVAVMQQAYGVWPLAAYGITSGIGYASSPLFTGLSGNGAQATGPADLFCDVVQSTLAGTGSFPSISAQNICMYNFNQIWVIPGNANPMTPWTSNYSNSYSVTIDSSKTRASPNVSSLLPVLDSNLDQIRPKSAPNVALVPIVDTSLTNKITTNAGLGGAARGFIQSSSQNPLWSYIFQNLNLLVDLVLPSDIIRQEYMEMFMSPQGINYAFTRIFMNYSLLGSVGSPLSGLQQFVVPIKVRSLKVMLCVFTDPYVDNISQDNTSYNLPSLSSFRMGGLYECYLQVGGETFPAHRFRFDTSMLQNSHIPELMSTLDVSMNTNYSPQYHISRLYRDGQNYMTYGTFDNNAGNGWANGTVQGPTIAAGQFVGTVPKATGTGQLAGAAPFDLSINRRYSYRDTSRFILAFNLAKVDNDFMSGIDCAQGTGSVVLFMNFAATTPRQLNLYTFSICDAVFTLQESQPLLRV